MSHNLEWKLDQIQKYVNTHHVWGLKSREISFALAKWEEVGKVFLISLVHRVKGVFAFIGKDTL